MKPLDMLCILYILLEEDNEGAINFVNALTHGVIQKKKENPKEYYKSLLKLINMYGEDIIKGLIDKNNGNIHKISIPDNWTWDDIEKLLSKEEE